MTNYRTRENNVRKEYTSRGHLVMQFVQMEGQDVEAYEKEIQGKVTKGFNLVYGNVRQGWIRYYQN